MSVSDIIFQLKNPRVLDALSLWPRFAPEHPGAGAPARVPAWGSRVPARRGRSSCPRSPPPGARPTSTRRLLGFSFCRYTLRCTLSPCRAPVPPDSQPFPTPQPPPVPCALPGRGLPAPLSPGLCVGFGAGTHSAANVSRAGRVSPGRL